MVQRSFPISSRVHLSIRQLDRLRRKLYLSLKVMGSTDGSTTDDKAGQLGTSEVMDILRKGSSALAAESPAGEPSAEFEAFLAAPIAEILAASRAKDTARDMRARADAGADLNVGAAEVMNAQPADAEAARRAAEEEEAALLRGVAQVQSRLFEGRVVATSKGPRPGDKKIIKEIAAEWDSLQKRARENRLVTVDGMQFVAPAPAPAVLVSLLLHLWRTNEAAACAAA
jgi:SWI/SNF-related matrix-associated actin-dependent regulator of chromatin subfamily A member 5